MPAVIGLMNMKGGCGKTLASVNLAAYLASFGRKTLLIDCDYQCNATFYLGMLKEAMLSHASIYQALIGEKSVEKVIIRTAHENLDLIPATNELVQFNDSPRDRYLLRNMLQRSKVIQSYDFVIIDSRPELSELLRNVGMASTHVIIPMFPEADSISGLSLLLKNLKDWSGAKRETCGEAIEILGYVISNFNKKISTHRNLVPIMQGVLAEKGIIHLATIPHSTGAAGSVEATTPIPYYQRLRNQVITKALEDLAKKVEKNTSSRRGRPKSIPTLSRDEVDKVNRAVFSALESDEVSL